MKSIKHICLGLLATLLLPMPALANASPGLGGVSLLLVLWIAVMFFTAIGGGYVIRKRKLALEGRNQSWEGIVYTIVAMLSLILAMSTAGSMIFAVLVTGGLAISRAVRLNQWSRSARITDGRPSYLEGINPARLALASWLLIAATIILAPASITFGVHGASMHIRASAGRYIVENLKEWTSEEIRFRTAPRTTESKADILSLQKKYKDAIARRDFSKHDCIFVSFSPPHERKFTIFVVPTRASIFIPAISFRADETGKIRAVKVYKPGIRCPEDGKVIADINSGENEINRLYSL